MTYREELQAIRARLKELHGVFRSDTSWLGIAAHEIGDALKEIPRASLADLPLIPRGPEPAPAPVVQRDVKPAKKRSACSICGQTGHNARGHEHAHRPELPAAVPIPPPLPAPPVERKKNMCGVCGERGHTKPRCPSQAAAHDDSALVVTPSAASGRCPRCGLLEPHECIKAPDRRSGALGGNF